MTKFLERRWEPKGGIYQIFLLVLETKKGGKVGWEVGNLSIRNLLNSLMSNSLQLKSLQEKSSKKQVLLKCKK